MLVGIFVLLLLLILLGIPVILAIAAVAMIGIFSEATLVNPLLPQKMFTNIDSFSLLAMPFFILAGSIMSKGGISRRLVEFAETAVGHLRGGLAHANVVASMVFSGVSGSSTADSAAMGSILIPSMKENGYKAGYAAAITATSSTIGPIIPPSMTMIIYGSMAGVSIGGLFLGGMIPGILIGLGLMAMVYLQSFLPQFPELKNKSGSFSLKRLLRSAGKVWVALLAPVIILGGIITGVFTATEAGVITVVYALITTTFVYRAMSWRVLKEIILDSAVTTAMVVGIISVAGALGWLLSYLRFNQAVLELVTGISTRPIVVLLVLLLIQLVLTMFVESLAILIILVPVAVYIGEIFGFDPYWFGVLLVMATQIGATTPPVAVLLFVSTSIAKCRYDETIRYAVPFVLTLVAVLLLVVLVPPLASWIPNAILGAG